MNNPDVPPIFSVPVAPLVKVPVPDRALVAVIVPLFDKIPGLATVSRVATVNVPELA